MKRSRDKAKQKADETMKKVTKLREGNKKLEGKIANQKETKKWLKDLFLEQTTKRSEKPTEEQLKFLFAKDDDDDEFASSASSESSDGGEQSESESESEPEPPKKSRKVKA